MKRLTCKKCNLNFNSASTLRSHQWTTHPEFYKKKGLVLSKNGTVLTAVKLLEELKEQHKFLDNAIKLIQGMLKQHEEKM
jgi:hypothetical protein